MSLIRLALLGAVATLLVACGSPRPLSEAAILERARAVTVTVEVDPGARVEVRPNPSTGAPELAPVPAAAQLAGGLVVGDGLVLTAAHLVDGAAGVTVRLADAEAPPLPATIVGVSACDDLALLQVDPQALEAPRLNAQSALELGAEVFTVGAAPVGAWAASPILSPGVITWRSPARGELPAGSLLLSSAALPPGYASAPLFSGPGEVVGLLLRGRFAVPAQYRDYVVGLGYAQAIAAELEARGAILRLGMDLAEVAEPDRSAYVRLFGPEASAGGLLVRGLAPEVAAQSGLQPGDLLIQVGGRPVAAIADLCGVLRDYSGGAPAPVAALRLGGAAAQRIEAALPGGAADPSAEEATSAARPAPTAAPAASAPTEGPLPTPARPAPVAALPNLSPADLQAARDALAAERARHAELFFETFDSDLTRRRWTPGDDAAGARQLIYSYYQLTLKQPNAIVTDAWPDRPLGPNHIVELEVALPPAGTAAIGIAFDRQTDGSGLSYFVIGADGSWQVAAFAGGALVPGYYARGVSPAFVGGGGSNFLRVVRLAEGVQLWLNETPVARAAPGPFAGGHAGVIALAGPEPLPQPVNLIADNLRVLER